MRNRWITGALAAVVLVAGCAESEPEAEAEAPATPWDSAATAPARDAVLADTAQVAAEAVMATLSEWTIELGADTVPAGPTTFRVVNTGEYAHAFEVEGGGGEWKTDPLPGGAEVLLTADLTPGTYEVYCPVDDSHGDHEALGMTTTLVVR